MGKTYKRGERMHNGNMKQKGRITDVIRSWGGIHEWQDDDKYSKDLRKHIVKSAKTRHPYSGDTRRVREEYRFPRGFERNAAFDEVE